MDAKNLERIAREYFDLGVEEDYKRSYEEFKKCYDKIINFPCVKEGTPLLLENAMYIVAYSIARNNFLKSKTDNYGNYFDNYDRKHTNIDDIVYEALYRIYGDDFISNLSSKCVLVKGLKK